jgi:undecaprenyl-diphosphatase
VTTAVLVLIGFAGAALICGLVYLIAGLWSSPPVSGDLPRGILLGRSVTYVAILAVGIVGSELLAAGFGRLVQIHAITHPDRAIYRNLVSRRTPWLTHLSSHVTGFGNQWVELTIAIVLGVSVAVWLRAPRMLFVLGLCILVEIELQKQMAHFVHSVKPSVVTSVGDPGGFPSGGVTRVFVAFGVTAVLVGATRSVRQRQALIAGAAALACVEAISRFYLGRHWLVDILGAFVLGGCLLATVAIAETVRGRPVRAPAGAT